MKTQVSNYTFSASTRAITFSNFPSGELRLDAVLGVFNETIGALMYTVGGQVSIAGTPVTATVATNVLTLSAVPVGCSDTDKLTIYYEAPNSVAEFVSKSGPAAGGKLVTNSIATLTLTATNFLGTEIEIANVDGAGIVYGTYDGTDPVVVGTGTVTAGFILPASPSVVTLPCLGNVTVKLLSPQAALVTAILRGG